MGKYTFLVGLRSSTAHTCHLFAWQWLELIWRLAQISQVQAEANQNKRCLSSRPYKLSLCPVWRLPATFIYCATLGKNCDIFLLELWWQVVLVWLWLMDNIDHLTASQTATKKHPYYWMTLKGCQARQKTYEASCQFSILIMKQSTICISILSSSQHLDGSGLYCHQLCWWLP